MRTRSSNLAVSKLAAYAEDPAAFIKVDGKAYNPKLAREGTRAHQRIGASPSKGAFIMGVLLVIVALVYFKVIDL